MSALPTSEVTALLAASKQMRLKHLHASFNAAKDLHAGWRKHRTNGFKISNQVRGSYPVSQAFSDRLSGYSKKSLRRQRAQKKRTEREKKSNPATLFILVIGILLAAIVVSVYVFGGVDSGPGDPPWPGAVWSPSHGYWR